MVEADNDEFTIVDNPQDTNYYTPIQDDKISEDNEVAQETDESSSLHREARESREEIRPEEIQSYNGNDNLIQSVETISNDAHLTNDNDTTKPQEAIGDEPTPDEAGSTHTRLRQFATYVHPVTGAHKKSTEAVILAVIHTQWPHLNI